MPQPPARENKALTWPRWPLKMRTSSSQEEGCRREFAVATRRALGTNGRIEALECAYLGWAEDGDRRGGMRELIGGEFILKADLVLLAMGFLGPRRDGVVEAAGLALDARGYVSAHTDDYRTSKPNVFACGDMRRGQSLVVWAIQEGPQCAAAVDRFLTEPNNAPVRNQPRRRSISASFGEGEGHVCTLREENA